MGRRVWIHLVGIYNRLHFQRRKSKTQGRLSINWQPHCIRNFGVNQSISVHHDLIALQKYCVASFDAYLAMICFFPSPFMTKTPAALATAYSTGRTSWSCLHIKAVRLIKAHCFPRVSPPKGSFPLVNASTSTQSYIFHQYFVLEIFHQPLSSSTRSYGHQHAARSTIVPWVGSWKGTDKRNFNWDFSCHAMELRRYFVHAKQNVRLVSLPRQQLLLLLYFTCCWYYYYYYYYYYHYYYYYYYHY